MAHLSDDEMSHLARLCRLEFNSKDKKAVLEDLEKMLSYIDQLNELDTGGVEPCTHVLEAVANVMREDEEGPLISSQEFLANAPQHVGGLVKVPLVIQF